VRIGEALALDRGDVDLENGALHIRARRPSKQREVPLHASTTEALRNYVRLRDRHRPKPTTPAFFLSVAGGRLTSGAFGHTFRELIQRVGLEGCGQRARPQAHDLRPTYTVRTLLGWYRSGEDVNRKLPLLSTYLGHADPESRYWYLEAVPELLALITSRLERLPEVVS